MTREDLLDAAVSVYYRHQWPVQSLFLPPLRELLGVHVTGKAQPDDETSATIVERVMQVTADVGRWTSRPFLSKWSRPEEKT